MLRAQLDLKVNFSRFILLLHFVFELRFGTSFFNVALNVVARILLDMLVLHSNNQLGESVFHNLKVFFSRSIIRRKNESFFPPILKLSVDERYVLYTPCSSNQSAVE